MTLFLLFKKQYIFEHSQFKINNEILQQNYNKTTYTLFDLINAHTLQAHTEYL